MDEEERRNQAATFHHEARQRVNNYPVTSGRWILAASAAGALACLNALTSSDIPSYLIETLVGAIQGYVFAMALTSAGLQYLYSGDVSDMMVWGNLDRPCADVPDAGTTDPLIKKAQRNRTISGWLLAAGGFAFMMTTIVGSYALSKHAPIHGNIPSVETISNAQ